MGNAIKNKKSNRSQHLNSYNWDTSESDNSTSFQVDTRRIFSPECIHYSLDKFLPLMKIYECILPKKFKFTLLNYRYHGFTSSQIELYLHHSFISLTDKKGREEIHDYFHVHSWGVKKGKVRSKYQLSIKYLDAVDKQQVYVMKGDKENIKTFTHNILEIINLIMEGYQIKNT